MTFHTVRFVTCVPETSFVKRNFKPLVEFLESFLKEVGKPSISTVHDAL